MHVASHLFLAHYYSEVLAVGLNCFLREIYAIISATRAF